MEFSCHKYSDGLGYDVTLRPINVCLEGRNVHKLLYASLRGKKRSRAKVRHLVRLDPDAGDGVWAGRAGRAPVVSCVGEAPAPTAPGEPDARRDVVQWDWR